MANWLIEQKIDLRRGEQAPQVWPNALMLCGDNNAHTWRVTVLDDGEAAQVTGSVTGYFVRPDGNTVTVQGSMAGNVASVVLAQACYAQEGDVKAVMRLSTADGAKVTLAAMILPVRNVLTDSIIDPGNVIPSLEDLLAQVAAMEALNDDVSAAEAGRVAAEQERVTAEEGREEAEAARASAESGRASAEQARAAAEAERVANEDERQQQLTNAINAAEADADRAEAAADAAETLIAMPPLFLDTPPTEAPTLNKLWIDTGVSPTMMRRWRGADGVTTAREYEETYVGRGKNIADVVSPYQVASQPPDTTVSTITPGSIQMSASAPTSSTWQAWRIWWPVKSGTNYTISVKMECDDDSYTPSLGVYTKTGINGATQSRTALTANGNVTINTNDNDFIGLYLHFTTDTGTSGARTVRYYDIQIEEGGTATAYEPYHDIPFLALDNAQGQIESVALEMGCVANQAGTGDPSPENIRAISGHESVEIAACGKNLLPRQTPQTKSGVTLAVQEDGGVHLSGTCTAAEGDPITFSVRMGVTLSGQYTFSMGNAQAIGDHLQMRLLESNNAQVSTVPTNFGASTANATNTFELDGQYVYGWLIRVGGGETYDVTLYPQLEAGDTATAFEPYRSMGGTVTPTEPIYGLPDAKDTVEVSTDGDVTVTRRTRVLELDGTENWVTYETSVAKNVRFRLNPDENIDIELPANNDTVANILCSHYTAVPNTQNGTFNCVNGVSVHAIEKSIMVFDNNYATENVDTWKSYLAAQAAAGTPVTIVYELAEPETEALTAILPIAPQAGQLNLTTDADALTATIYGSGWDTISDQTGLLATIAQLTARVAALEQAEVNTINTTEG